MNRYKKPLISIELLVILLVIPYLGSFGSLIFSYTGKIYYIFLSAIILLSLFYDGIFKNRKIVFTKRFSVLIVILLFVVGFTLITKNEIQNSLFLVILFIFFSFGYFNFSLFDFKSVGFVSTILFYLFSLISIVKKCGYFNPNSYAFISSALFFLSSFYVSKIKKGKVVFFFNFAIAITLTYFIYNSATQLICVLFFSVLFWLKKSKLTSRSFYSFLTCIIFVFVAIFPFAIYLFIKNGLLGLDFFTNRGYRWAKAIELIKESGLFGINLVDLGSHNGFLEISLKYSLFLGIVYIFILTVFLLKFCNRLFDRTNEGKIIFIYVLSLILMNISESFFIGLTDSYFLVFGMSFLAHMLDFKGN